MRRVRPAPSALDAEPRAQPEWPESKLCKGQPDIFKSRVRPAVSALAAWPRAEMEPRARARRVCPAAAALAAESGSQPERQQCKDLPDGCSSRVHSAVGAHEVQFERNANGNTLAPAASAAVRVSACGLLVGLLVCAATTAVDGAAETSENSRSEGAKRRSERRRWLRSLAAGCKR